MVKILCGEAAFFQSAFCVSFREIQLSVMEDFSNEIPFKRTYLNTVVHCHFDDADRFDKRNKPYHAIEATAYWDQILFTAKHKKPSDSA